jgi:hypothetical protein
MANSGSSLDNFFLITTKTIITIALLVLAYRFFFLPLWPTRG